MRVVVWNEFRHEREPGPAQDCYPDGIHATVAAALRDRLAGAHVETATFDDDEHGLAAERLEKTDVLLWWDHRHQNEVRDEVVDRIIGRVHQGMGFIALHSAHASKPFKRLMGTGCGLRWRVADDRELIWTVAPWHPIAQGVPPVIELEQHEMYGEYFDIPTPDDLVFISSFTGGEVFRSGCCFARGRGRIFTFSPGHETYPVYHHPAIQRVLANAVQWAYSPAPTDVGLGVRKSDPGWWRR